MAGHVSKSTTRLTKRNVEQVQVTAKPVFVWDSELRGFGVRVEPTGTRTFILRYRLRGAGPSGPKRFLTIGRYGPLTVDQAREQAKAVLGAVTLGNDPADELSRTKTESTFAAVAELFLTEHIKAKRKDGTYADYASLLRVHALPSLASRKLTDITRGIWPDCMLA